VALILGVAVVFWWQRRMEAGVESAQVPSLFWSFDDYVYYYPTFHYAFDELRSGRWPLWNPHQHAGSPFFATAQHGILYPPNLIHLFVSTAAAEKINAILHLAFAGFGAALLARAWSIGWPAAAVTGIAFALAPPVSALVFLPHHLYGVAWMPYLLMILHRLLASSRPWRWVVPLGGAVAFQYLGGYPMYCLISVYLLAGYAGWWQWHTRQTATLRRVAMSGAALAAAAIFAASLSAPQLLPSLELAQRSLRGVAALSLEEAALNSVHPSTSLLRSVLPMYDVEGVLPNVYVGMPILLLAGLGAASSWRNTPAGFFVLATVVSWLLAMGTHTPLFNAYYLLPGGGAFRVPFRFFPATSLAIAVLAGIGVSSLWRQRVPASRLLGILWALLGLGMAALLIAWFAPLPERLEPAVSRPPSFPSFMFPVERPDRLLGFLGTSLLASAAWMGIYLRAESRLRRLLVLALVPIVYGVLFVATRNSAPLPATHPDLHTMPESAVAFLREKQGTHRTLVAHSLWPLGPKVRHVPAKSGMLHGLYVVGDRENVYSRRFADFVGLIPGPDWRREIDGLAERAGLPPLIPQGQVFATATSPHLRLLDLLGTRFIVEGPGTNFDAERLPERFKPIFNADGVRIFLNAKALPRVFVAHAAEVFADTTRLLERLPQESFDPRMTVLLERAPPIELQPSSTSDDRARITLYEPSEVSIQVDAAAAGILVLTDMHYPGWYAEVDGIPTEILTVDYLFRGVPVRAGSHEVAFRFAPPSTRYGAVVAIVGALVAIALARGLRRWNLSSWSRN
jgi:hypothetical protein